MSYPGGWMQPNFLDDGRIEIPPPTTTTTSIAAVTSTTNNPAPDRGRGSRPMRRRSRASQRTPITFNTDTNNFRAMVQRYTGSPATITAEQATATAGILDLTQHMAAHLPPNLYHVQYPNQMQQHPMVLSGDRMHGPGGVGGVSPHAPPASSSTNGSRYYNYML